MERYFHCADIMLLNTSFGAAADLDGKFFIVNIPPGIYNAQAKMMGYTSVKMENIHFGVNSATNLQLKLEQTTLQGEEIVVTASAVSFKKDTMKRTCFTHLAVEPQLFYSLKKGVKS
jgi:hypothetical protein